MLADLVCICNNLAAMGEPDGPGVLRSWGAYIIGSWGPWVLVGRGVRMFLFWGGGESGDGGGVGGRNGNGAEGAE